jgi:hypothetical protein
MSNLANMFKFSELWNASSNMPCLNASSCVLGSWYIVSHPGMTNLTGLYSINAVHMEGSNNATVLSTAADLALWRMGDALVCIYMCVSKCNMSVVVVNSMYLYMVVMSPNAMYAHMWFKLVNLFMAPKPKLYKRYWDMDNVVPVCCSDSALVPLLAMELGLWIWARAVEGGPSNRTLVFPPLGSMLQHDPYLMMGDYFEVNHAGQLRCWAPVPHHGQWSRAQGPLFPTVQSERMHARAPVHLAHDTQVQGGVRETRDHIHYVDHASGSAVYKATLD